MITDEMVEQAALVAWLSGGLNTVHDWHAAESVERVQYLREARVVLEYAATLGPTREERLMRYRCAALTGIMGCYTHDDDKPVHIADAAEAMAHAMLAAERPATETPDTSVEHVARLALAEAELAVLRELTAAQERALTRLRDALRRELDEGDLEACGPRDDLRALLPPTEVTP